MEVEGRRPVGRQKNSWNKVVEEDMRKLNIMEDVAEDLDNSGGDSYHVQPQEWETRDIKRKINDNDNN